MAEKLLMLALSPTMERGTIVKWHKQEGDAIAPGDVLCEVETDKAVMEYPASTEGVLLKILVPEGGSAAVEEPIGVAGRAREDISELLKTVGAGPGAVSPTPEEKPIAAPMAEGGACPVGMTAIKSPDGKVKSSPLARRLAEQAGLDLTNIRGTGPDGRITRQDVEREIHGREEKPIPSTPVRKPPPKAPTPEPVPLPTMAEETILVSPKRKVIAERLTGSKFSAPHFYLRVSPVFDAVLAARNDYNAEAEEKLSLNAFLMKLTAEAIKRHPAINSSWQGETIRRFGRIDMALAVAQPDGLVAPVVRDCGGKGIVAIDRELRGLIERAKANQLSAADYENATFTISNLGSFGIEEFTAIINPPGSAILAVGAIEKRTLVGSDEEILIRSVATLTLSCDHRVIDGAVGAAFLKELKQLIESPIRAMM